MSRESAPQEDSPQPARALTIAVDAMGGYQAPAELIEAVAASSLKGGGVYFMLVGDEEIISSALNQLNHNPERVSISHAADFIGQNEPAQAAYAQKPDNSISKACELVASGQADAVVSAGSPVAATLAAQQHLKLLPGIQRAALAAVYPSPRAQGQSQDPFSLILDVGASWDADAQDLVGFALMGAAYARTVSLNERPKIGLLSASREPQVGPLPVVQAHQALLNVPGIDFIGNIEGHDIPKGRADVIVCDGYAGDLALKILEGVGEAAWALAKSAYEESFIYRQGLRLLAGGIKKLRPLIDFEEYGGAPLLGVDHVMILAHPRSQRRAIENAIRLAIKTTRQDLPLKLEQAIAQLNALE